MIRRSPWGGPVMDLRTRWLVGPCIGLLVALVLPSCSDGSAGSPADGGGDSGTVPGDGQVPPGDGQVPPGDGPAPPVCGDDDCGGGETCSSCPDDCGGCAAVITVGLVPSRGQGVAPLAVFFDASTTTASEVARPFHE